MNLYIFAGVMAIGLIIILVVVFILNRAWGDFPGRVAGLPPPITPNMPPNPPTNSFSPTLEGFARSDTEATLVSVQHPLVKRAVLAALERGGSPYALYFVKEGDLVYFVPNRVADMQQRDVLIRMFNSLNSDDDNNISFADIIRVLQELGRK